MSDEAERSPTDVSSTGELPEIQHGRKLPNPHGQFAVPTVEGHAHSPRLMEAKAKPTPKPHPKSSKRPKAVGKGSPKASPKVKAKAKGSKAKAKGRTGKAAPKKAAATKAAAKRKAGPMKQAGPQPKAKNRQVDEVHKKMHSVPYRI